MPLFFRQSLRPKNTFITNPIPKVIPNPFLYKPYVRPTKTLTPHFQTTQTKDDKASKEAQNLLDKKKAIEASNDTELYAKKGSASVHVRDSDKSYYPVGTVIPGKEFEEGVKKGLEESRRTNTGYY